MFIKYKVRQAGATFLGRVLVYMVVDSMNERMKGVMFAKLMLHFCWVLSHSHHILLKV